MYMYTVDWPFSLKRPNKSSGWTNCLRRSNRLMCIYCLTACLVAEVCQAFIVFQMRKEPLSVTLESSKSIIFILSCRFQTSIVFFLNSNHLIYTFILCFCSPYCFYFAFSCIYILPFRIPFLSVEGCTLIAHVTF